MFEEQYRHDNDKLHADPALLMEIQKKADAEKRVNQRRAAVLRYGAAAAAVVLVIGGTVGVLASRGMKNSATESAEMSADAASMPMVASANGRAVNGEIADYDALFELVDSLQYGNTEASEGAMREEAATDMAAPESAQADMGSSNSTSGSVQNSTQSLDKGGATTQEYSETNVQVKGVDEADIIKTDGRYIYYTAGGQFVILSAEGADTRVLSTVNFIDGENWVGNASEMFLSGDRLVIVTQSSSTVWVDSGKGKVDHYQDQTRVLIYDVSDREHPKRISSLGQSGNYLSARRIGDYVYVVTTQYVWSVYRNTVETYCPVIYKEDVANTLEVADIYVYDRPNEPLYTVIGVIDLTDGTQYAGSKAVLGNAGEMYANANHLLLAASEERYDTSEIAPDKTGKNVQITSSVSDTRLMLFTIDGAAIERTATATVRGTILNQFAMDEYDGAFRIVTTVNEWERRVYTDGVDSYEYDSKTYNCLYTLDAALNPLGSIENLAKDEWVESVRFDGPIGYFVTFRQTDPLFTVDLSDPKKPRILSTLKIPGFSEYLHVFDDGLLLGIGYSADEETGWREGVKLSMFDVSDPKNVAEIASLRMDAGWSMIGSNHKAVLVDSAKNIIAFPADNKYYVFSYDAANKAFVRQATVGVSSDVWSYDMRGVFIGDNLYVVSESAVIVISMTDYERIAKVSLYR